MSCLLCRVIGRVQGVWFRASTRREAQPLGITGHAVNLSDGSVEVLACGEAESLERLKEWLRRGPPGARVDRLHCEAVEAHSPGSFSTG